MTGATKIASRLHAAGLASLRTRMALFVAAVLVGPVLLILGLSWASYLADIDEAAERNERLAAFVASDRHILFDNMRELLVAFAASASVLDQEGPRCGGNARRVVEQTPALVALRAFTRDGAVFCQSHPERPATAATPDTPWFRRILTTLSPQLGDTVVPIGGLPTLPIAIPYVTGGALRGVVAADIDLIWLSRTLVDIAPSRDTAVTIIDRAGRILARWPNPEQWIGRALPAESLTLKAMAESGGHPTRLISIGLDGIERVAVIHPFKGDASGNIFAVVSAPLTQARQGALTTAGIGLAALLGVLAIAVGVAWLGAGWAFLQPIELILSAIRRQAGGDLDARVGASGRGELAELGRAFDHLANSRAQAEAGLRQTEAFLRGIVDNMLDGLLTIDERGRVLTMNPAAERIMGYSPIEVIGNNVSMLVPEPDRSLHDGYIRQYLETGVGRILGVGQRRLEALTKDGRRIPIDLGISEMVVGGSRTFIGTIRDMTLVVDAEARLRASEERHRLVAEAMTDTVWQWDAIRDATEWTGALEVSFGYDPKDAAGGLDWWSGRIHPDDRAEILEKVAQFRMAGTSATMTLSYLWRRADDKYAAVTDRWTALRAADGTLAKAIVGMVDVTATREVEQQLRQSQKMEAVGQLTGGIAHDFNNLLGIVIGNLDILSDLESVKGDSLATTLTDEALKGALRGAELNRRLLAFARRQSLKPEMVEVAQTLKGVAEILRRSLGERIHIEIKLDDGLWPVRADPSQFDAALLNLAVNARDAMPDGGGLTIEARNATFDAEYADAHVEVEPGDYVAVSVADTGTGMSPEVLGRVFEPFFTTKEVGRGTGLGLSMVHGFVKQSGGHVTIYSEIGRGTVVRLYLPRATTAETKRDAYAVPQAENGHGQSILVVEDNPILRKVVVRLLTALDYRVTETGDATEAMRILEGGLEIDLLFTDVVIPGPMDGIELARRGRALRPGLKVLLTSGFTERAAARSNGHGTESGPLPPLLSKPYRKSELATTVAAILAARDRAEGDA